MIRINCTKNLQLIDYYKEGDNLLFFLILNNINNKNDVQNILFLAIYIYLKENLKEKFKKLQNELLSPHLD